MSWVEEQRYRIAVRFAFLSTGAAFGTWAYSVNRAHSSWVLQMNHAQHMNRLGIINPHHGADAFRIVGKSGARRIIPIYFRKKLITRIAAKLVGRAVPGLGWALLVMDAWAVGKWIGHKLFDD